MTFRKNLFRKILIAAGWLLGTIGILVLLVAAISKRNQKVCTGIDMNITGASEYLFLDREDILEVISYGNTNPPKGRVVSDFDLKKLETFLEKNVWVKKADLFFDNNQVLKVNIEEREPIARIFTVSGRSYYVDSSGAQLPLSSKMSIRLPVFTNFPSDKVLLTEKDAQLMKQIRRLSAFILHDPFWMAQIAQIDITVSNTFEIVPLVGNHVIRFGDGNDIEGKFHRLMLFYKQVSSKYGFDKYSFIDVQYDKQVVGTKKGTISKSDSIQTLNNIRRLIDQSHKLPVDTVSTSVDNNMPRNRQRDSILTVLKPAAQTTKNNIRL